MSDQDQILSYVDNILISTVDHEENQRILETVLEKIYSTGFLVNSAKAQLVQTEVTYLGIHLSPNGKQPDRQRVGLICKLPIPRDISALRSFLGLKGFSREFIEDYATIARPLYRLFQKG